MKFAHVLSLVLSVMICGYASAEDKPGKKKKGDALPPLLAQVQESVSTLELKEEDKTKIKTIIDEFKPKFVEQQKKMEGNLTDEQKKASKEAMEKAKADGKKGKDLKLAVEESVKLTDEQKQAKTEAAKAGKELTTELKKSLSAVLNEEQMTKINLGGPKKKDK
jgi:hypothetical protein